MIVDYLSDLHLDFYFRHHITAENVKKLFSPIFLHNGQRKTGDVLIVAGDIGHYNTQNIQVLKMIKKIFEYKHIICVLGNHDYYLLDSQDLSKYKKQSLNRVIEMRELINAQEGMYCLDGNIVEIEGVKFGGCDGWYDAEYIHEHFGERSSRPNYLISNPWINQYWGNYMMDSKKIYDFSWMDYAAVQKGIIEKIYKEVDVMVTHINPSIHKEHSHIRFREMESTGFFTFNGEYFLKNSTIKYWVFGHTHEEIEFELHNTQCVCNPMGYPGESMYGKYTDIKSFEIKVQR